MKTYFEQLADQMIAAHRKWVTGDPPKKDDVITYLKRTQAEADRKNALRRNVGRS